MIRVILLVAITALAACGVKSNLVKPNGQPDSRTERNSSLPPNQTGR